MAATAVLTEPAKMNIRFNMATNTIIRCAGYYRGRMAASAINLNMSSIEWKSLLVIEMDHAVKAIVASSTIIPIKDCMSIGEGRISLSMAFKTIDKIDSKLVVQVAISAFDRLPVKSRLVPV